MPVSNVRPPGCKCHEFPFGTPEEPGSRHMCWSCISCGLHQVGGVTRFGHSGGGSAVSLNGGPPPPYFREDGINRQPARAEDYDGDVGGGEMLDVGHPGMFVAEDCDCGPPFPSSGSFD